MKLFFNILPALFLACTITLAHAQQAVTMEEGHMPKKGKRLESRGMENYVMMKDGKMMAMKDGKTMPMTQEMTMNNGTKVMTDGSVTMAGGKKMMLHNGQMMLLDGQIMDHSQLRGKMKKSSM